MHHHIVKQAEADLAAAFLTQIDPEERLIAGLFFYEQLTIDEIAIILKQEKSTIFNALNNIFTALLPEESDNKAGVSVNGAAKITVH
jgi:predicted transcriptional regulator